ncbi:hypothetical protein ACFL6P_00095 [Candidatus Latescibacterota bacterium]|jgi:hypothetical protein
MKEKNNENKFPRALPVFRGYTVDFRLSEFRKVLHGLMIEFISFSSEKGMELLDELYLEWGEEKVDQYIH